MPATEATRTRSGTDRLANTFRHLRELQAAALVTFVTAGDPWPTVSRTAELVVALARAGADIIELGIPYSDPQADGPSIQASSQRSLDSGTTPPFVLDVVREARRATDVPIVLMTYYNPVLRYGLTEFASDAADAGVDGVILTDLPPEEARPWLAAAENSGIAPVFLLAPTSTDARIVAVAAHATRGFVYCVSRTGVTGTHKGVSADLSDLLARIRAKISLPVCVGFGINTPEQVAQIASVADGAVIGSALVDFLHRSSNSSDVFSELSAMVAEWKRATQRRT